MSNIEFTKKDLEDVATLSRLHLEEDEKEKFLGQMKEVLEYVGQVSEMASENVENSGGANYGKQFENSVNKNGICFKILFSLIQKNLYSFVQTINKNKKI